MKIDIKKIGGALLLAAACISNAAFAQWVPGQLVTAQLLNSAFAAVAANALPVTGGTLTGPLQGTAATFNSGSFASLSSSGPVTLTTPWRSPRAAPVRPRRSARPAICSSRRRCPEPAAALSRAS